MEAQDEFNDIISSPDKHGYLQTAGAIFINSQLSMIEQYNSNGENESQMWHLLETLHSNLEVKNHRL